MDGMSFYYVYKPLCIDLLAKPGEKRNVIS